MTRTLLLLAGLALSFGAGPAFALKNIEGCDIVAFAAKDSPISITPEQWLAYREASEAALASPHAATALLAAQEAFLEPVKTSTVYQDYLASESCRVISKLNESAVDTLLAEAVATAPAPIGEALAQIVATMRIRIQRIDQTARFRSAKDKTLFAARYYCFIAASIVAFLPPERRAETALEDFGDTISCKDAGRA